MSFQNQFTKTTTDANLMETVHHGSAEYPFRYYYENIALFDFKCIDWHWHSELEFIYIESGNVVFDIGTVLRNHRYFMLYTATAEKNCYIGLHLLY